MPSIGTKRQVSVIFYWEMTSRHVAMLCLVAGLTYSKTTNLPARFFEIPSGRLTRLDGRLTRLSTDSYMYLILRSLMLSHIHIHSLTL